MKVLNCRMSFWICISVCFFYLGGCVTTPPPKPADPVEPLVYDFKFEQEKPFGKKLGITIGILDPQWGEDSLDYSTHFSVKSQERLNAPNYNASKGPLPSQMVEILDEFNRAVGSEYEAMMLSRGFDISGPFSRFEDMTYPQKKSANLLLVPEFTMMLSAEPQGSYFSEMTGEATIKGEIVLNILEPLSREKLWLKRITIKSDPFPYKYEFKYRKIYNKRGDIIAVQRDSVSWDNRTQRFASELTKFYDNLMKTAWDYFSPEELAVLKTHSDEIRKNKRF